MPSISIQEAAAVPAAAAAPSRRLALSEAAEEQELWDCCIVGGGPAGLSAALMLGRARRRVMVFDSGEKRNEASLVQHAILGADGFDRPSFLNAAREQVLAYPTVHFRCLAVCDIDVLASQVERPNDGGSGGENGGENGNRACTLADGTKVTATERFVVHTEDGRRWRAKKAILATGVRDLIPDIEGFEEYWGHGIWVCLFCDAYEYSGQALGAYGNGERGVHIAFEMLLWSRDVTLFTDGEELHATDLEREQLARQGVRVIETPIARAVGDGSGHLAGLVLQDGCFVPLKALFFNTGRVQSSRLPQRMGLAVDDRGDILCEVKGNVQAVHGLFVAGNCAAAPLKLVMTAASQGAVTGAKARGCGAEWVNSELLYEELGLDRQEGERYMCSLEGARTSAGACARAYGGGARHKRAAVQPTAGGPEEEVEVRRRQPGGAAETSA